VAALVTFLVVNPIIGIQVVPVGPGRAQAYNFTYKIDPGCVNANASKWVSTFINMAEYRDGCGSWGDRVPHMGYDDNGNSGYNGNSGSGFGYGDADMDASDRNVWGIAVCAPVVIYGVLWGILCGIDCAYQDTKGARKWLIAAWSLLYGILALVLFAFAMVAQTYPDTWICRPYVATFDAFDDVLTIFVDNSSPNRGSAILSLPSDWDHLTSVIQPLCSNIQLLDTPPNRRFSIDFQPNPNVAELLSSVRATIELRSLIALAILPAITLAISILFCCQRKNSPELTPLLPPPDPAAPPAAPPATTPGGPAAPPQLSPALQQLSPAMPASNPGPAPAVAPALN
jgi:hypothetical protein